jgi:N-acetylneuraminic acid mutarotase
MIRTSSCHIGIAAGLLALTACSETATEPETARPLADIPVLSVSNSWITRASLPSQRSELATATVPNAAGQSIVYAIAGRTPAAAISPLNQAYNVVTNTWTTRAPLPTRLYATNGAGVINGKIYVSGGIGIRRIGNESIYRYDPATNTWTRPQILPGPGFRGVTGVISNQLYILTGCFSGADCDPVIHFAFYRYNPATNVLTSLPTPSSTHDDGMAGVVGGKFYVVGGRDELNQLDVYNPATNTWTTRAPMPKGQFAAGGRWAGAGLGLGTKFYVMGGWQRDNGGGQTAARTTNVYNPATDVWSAKAILPTGRANNDASRVVVNGQARIELVGGSSPGNNLQYIP